MTPEEWQQAETVAEIRARFGMAYECGDSDTLAEFVAEILKIADSQTQKIEAMQKQLNAYSLLTEAAGSLMQKQYTEAELWAWFDTQPLYQEEIDDLLTGQDTDKDHRAWLVVLRFARFLGAIKEKKG